MFFVHECNRESVKRYCSFKFFTGVVNWIILLSTVGTIDVVLYDCNLFLPWDLAWKHIVSLESYEP